MTRTAKSIILCALALLLFMISTQPAKLPSALLIMPFLLFFGVLTLLVTKILRWRGMSRGKSIRTGIMVAALPIFILVLQSLGQLTVRDLLTIFALSGITYFYLSKITRPASG
jgi:xanthine/uracil permease